MTVDKGEEGDTDSLEINCILRKITGSFLLMLPLKIV